MLIQELIHGWRLYFGVGVAVYMIERKRWQIQRDKMMVQLEMEGLGEKRSAHGKLWFAYCWSVAGPVINNLLSPTGF